VRRLGKQSEEENWSIKGCKRLGFWEKRPVGGKQRIQRGSNGGKKEEKKSAQHGEEFFLKPELGLFLGR